MRYSQALLPTLKEAPKDATMPSHVLMLRAGYCRMVGAGIYELLPLGMRVLRNVERVIREEMDAAGAQEIHMPTLLPAEYFQETGRYDLYGPTLFRLKDRKDGLYHLAPTHEEIVTDLVRREINSYRQLPLNLYQIQLKYRDEPRPRAGLLRGREFLMKDAYSFDANEVGAQKSYRIMRDAYHKIFQRLGLSYRVVEADSGAIGGKTSAEFQVLVQTGEDRIVACSKCDYAANAEVAAPKVGNVSKNSPHSANAKEKIHTPNVGTIDDVVKFLGGSTTSRDLIKSLVYMAGDNPVLALVRGDREINELLLARALGVDAVHLANDAQVHQVAGTKPGFVGPVGFKGKTLVDPEVAALSAGISGALEKDYHYKNLQYGRDFSGEIHSIRAIAENDPCPKCGSALTFYRGIEGGHIFVLGTHYSEKMNARFVDEDGKEKPFVMGCYGIGVSRLVATVIEQHHDDFGIRWPLALAPYQVSLVALGKQADVSVKADAFYQDLQARGVEVLYDDRDERPGVKFKDADLVGMPLRVTVGGKGLERGIVELKWRNQKEFVEAPLAQCVDKVCEMLASARSNPKIQPLN